MKLGLVASYSGPAGNVTGVDLFSGTVGPKRLKILRELVPQTEPPFGAGQVRRAFFAGCGGLARSSR